MTRVKPPTDVSAAARKLWRSIYDSADIDAPALPLLDVFVQQYDRMVEAREILKTCGIQASPYTYGGAKASPKHRLVHCYSSQASAGSLDEIALYRGGSERLWMTSEFRETWIKTGLYLK